MHKLGWLAAAVIAATLSPNAQAQSGVYPVKPVKLIVGFALESSDPVESRRHAEAKMAAKRQAFAVLNGPAALGAEGAEEGGGEGGGDAVSMGMRCHPAPGVGMRGSATIVEGVLEGPDRDSPACPKFQLTVPAASVHN